MPKSKSSSTELGVEFLSLPKAAVRGDVSADFLRDAISRGDLPAYRVGKGPGRIRIRISDLDSLMRSIAK